MRRVRMASPSRRQGDEMLIRKAGLLVKGIALAVALAATPSAGWAMDRVPYSVEEVDAAKANGQKIILGIWAIWCTTCQAQISILDRLAEDPRFNEITIFHIDYDRQKYAMRLVGAAVKSQMIAFDGAEEIGRLIGTTDADRIESFLVALVDH
jgi:thioredoxin 1